MDTARRRCSAFGRRSLRRLLGPALAIAAFSLTLPACAQQAAELLRTHAEAGTLAAGEALLAARVAADPNDAGARGALGFARFVRSAERLGQSLHRHGLRAPNDFAMMLPVLRFPVPPNANPQPLDYARMRGIYAALLADLQSVESTLAGLPPGDFKLRIDLNAVRLDLDGDGKGAANEALGAIVQSLSRPPVRRSTQSAPQAPPDDTLPPWNVAFDRADAIWLRGYAKLLSAFCEFALAHDWSDAFNTTAHMFFPRIEGGSAVSRLEASTDNIVPGMRSSAIADAIAFVHLLRFPVVEPARMQRVRTLLLETIRLSRENWKEILAETDDESEWLPSPRQKNSAISGPAVTQDIIDAWHVALRDFEDALEGRALLGHWRFNRGIDLRQVFEEPRTFDLVLWLTGPGVVPFLKDGRVLNNDTLRTWQRLFGGNFLGFALWFN